MTVDSAKVLRDAGAGPADNDLANEVLDEANAYVGAYATGNLIDATVPVPDAAMDAAVLACATDLFNGKKAPYGQQIGTDSGGAPVVTRIGSDPLARVRPLLRPWVLSAGFAYPADDESE